MSDRRSQRSFLAPLSALLMAVSCVTVLEAAPPEEKKTPPSENSGALGAEVTTNLNALNPSRNGLQRFEDALTKPLQTFSTKGSLDGMIDAPMPSPARPVAPKRRPKDALDFKKDWVYFATEDFATGLRAEDILKMPSYDQNGVEKKKLSPFDRYLDRLDKKRNELGKTSDDDLFGGRNENRSPNSSDAEEEPDLVKSLKASENDLKKMFSSEEKGGMSTLLKPVLTDFLGAGARPLSKDEMETHRQRLNDYGNLIGLESQPFPDNPLNSLSPVRASSWGEIYTPSRLAPSSAYSVGKPAAALPGLPAALSPAASSANPYTIEPAAVQAPTPTVRPPPQALPSIMDIQRKF